MPGAEASSPKPVTESRNTGGVFPSISTSLIAISQYCSSISLAFHLLALPLLNSWTIFQRFPNDEVIRPLAEPELQQTVYLSRKGPYQDISFFHGAFRINQEELSSKPTCSRNLTHHRHATKWNWLHIILDPTGIEFTKHVILGSSILADNDLWLLFDGFQPNHKDFSFQTSCVMFLAQLELASKWNQPSISSYEKIYYYFKLGEPELTWFRCTRIPWRILTKKKVLIYEPSCYVILTHQRHTTNWI